MPGEELTRRQREALRSYKRSCRAIMAELADIGFCLQGSVIRRWMECGKAGCLCHVDEKARHGPYHQWSWKSAGRTCSVYLDEEQAAICKQWISNNRRLEKVVRRLRALSLRAARLYKIARK